MRNTIIKHTDGDFSLQYGVVVPASAGVEWFTHVELSESDLERIRELKEPVQGKINAILQSYTNL